MTDTLLAIDPGKHACGWAFFKDGKLKCVGHQHWREIFVLGPPAVVAVEMPRANYRQRSKGVNDNDLLEVAFAAGAVVGAYPGAQLLRFPPQDWKGTTPKHVTEHRVRAKLSGDELDLVLEFKKSVQNHIWDAIGIGFYAQNLLRKPLIDIFREGRDVKLRVAKPEKAKPLKVRGT